MEKNRRGFALIRQDDEMSDLPKQWNESMEAITNQLDDIDAKISTITNEIEYLRRLYYSPESR